MTPAREVSIPRQHGDIIQAVAADPKNQSVILGERSDVRELAESVARSLNDSPPWLHCKYLYDDRGSHLFEEITKQPEYYPTRTEASILARHAGDIARITGEVTLIELGSGSATKTDYLLTAYGADERPVTYVPVDVSVAALENARDTIVGRHPNVTVAGIAGTYDEAFPLFTRFSPSMVIFLGSTIGNFNQQEADVFWKKVAAVLHPGDYFLLGVDLVKDEDILNAAYNDAAGVTDAFTKNLIVRINRELGASVDLGEVEHVASYSSAWQRIETFLRFKSDQDVYIAPLDQTIPISAETMVMTEISRKFTIEQIRENMRLYGFDVRRVVTDDKEWFGLLLLERAANGEGRIGKEERRST